MKKRIVEQSNESSDRTKNQMETYRVTSWNQFCSIFISLDGRIIESPDLLYERGVRGNTEKAIELCLRNGWTVERL